MPEQQLRELFLIRVGDIYNQRLFEESVKKLNDCGWLDPLDKDKDTNFETNEEEATISIAIKIQKRSEKR